METPNIVRYCQPYMEIPTSVSLAFNVVHSSEVTFQAKGRIVDDSYDKRAR